VTENPIYIKALDHVVLRVADLDRALTFYRDTLGCEIERSIKELGLVQLRAGAALIDLVPVDSELGLKLGAGPAKQGRNMDHFALELDNFDADLIRVYLEARRVNVGEVGDRYGAQGFGPSIYIQDPDGNTVELKGPARSGTLLRA
tara:strand:- start:97 stop:534 length:438 start_codon:yes stop_codon:yes gene_type:complete